MNTSDISSLLSKSVQLNQKVIHQYSSRSRSKNPQQSTERQLSQKEGSGKKQLSKMSDQCFVAEPAINQQGRLWESIHDAVWVNLKCISSVWCKQTHQLCSPLPLDQDCHNSQAIQQSFDSRSTPPPYDGEWVQLSLEETPLLIYSTKESSAVSLFLELVELPNRRKSLQATTFNIPHSMPKSIYNEHRHNQAHSISNPSSGETPTALQYLALTIGQTIRFTDIAHPKNRDALSPILKWRAELLPIQEEIIKRYQLRLQEFLMQELNTYGLPNPSAISYPNPNEMIQLIDARDKVASLNLIVHLMKNLNGSVEKSQPTKLQSQLGQIDGLLEPLISSWVLLPEDQPPANSSERDTLERALLEDSSAYWTSIIPQIYS